MNDKICICGDPNCTIPFGTCHCTCRRTTRIYPCNNKSLGWVKGTHAKYFTGHVMVKPRPPVIQPDDPNYRIVALTQGKVAMITTVRYEWAMQWMWHAWWCKENETFYARRATSGGERRAGKPDLVGMHCEIMPAPKGLVVDHKNRNGLDNRDENLRVATYTENQMNRVHKVKNDSGFKGVRKGKSGKTWFYELSSYGHTYREYGFPTPEDAAIARQHKAQEIHGDFELPPIA